MKRIFEHPAPSARELNGPKYWRSLDELSESPGFIDQLKREFPQGAAELEGVDRRQFMKIMAASFALGGIGLAGCRRPEANILPFGKSVEGIIPGLPQYYATAMPLRGSAIPLLAETHQGRPTKLEGNPTYKQYGGASTLFAQASILDLYDPDRATAHLKGKGETKTVLKAEQVNELLATISQTYTATKGAGLAFLADQSSSPTRARLVAKLRAKFPQATWAEYEPVTDEAPAAAAQAAFGASVKPIYQFAKAKYVLSLDADFFHAEAGSTYYAREFARARRVKKPTDTMNRLYVAESAFTLTGGMADHRLRIATSHIGALAAAIGGKILNADLKAYTEGLDAVVSPKWVEECAADLLAHKGESLVVVGAHLPPVVHALGYAINTALGAIGQTVDFVEVPASTAATISTLATAIKGGSVKTLVILGGNPVYNAPADLGWEGLQKSVAEVVRLGYMADETSAVSTVNLAAAHYLESWGDARTHDGTIVPVQPMILPLFGGLTQIEVIARLAGEANADGYALVTETITPLAGGNAEKAMRRFLHDGLLEGSEYKKVSVKFDAARARAAFPEQPKKVTPFSSSNLEVRFIADLKMDDGRFNNNGWLQECPDPITKISWDNTIMVSPRLGKELGIAPEGASIPVARVEENEFEIGKEKAFVFTLTVGGKSVTGPVHIQPGLANYTVVVALGYGRTETGRVGKDAGFSAYPLRTAAAQDYTTGGTLAKTEKRQLLANTQEHWSMEGRDIVREANYDEFTKNPKYVDGIGTESHSPPIYGDGHTPVEDKEKLSREERAVQAANRAKEIPRGGSMYSTPKFDGHHQWGMSIDLNTCIGCNACVVACQAENNIPIVGRDQVQRGREMHWIRLDRYYSDGKAEGAAFGGPGNKEIPEDPQVSLQPIACAQCELAPCETVCPVNATVHDDEGINTMAYNRCIGTRYCANNCPYKVRRFNFFDFNQRHLDSLYLGQAGPKGMPELVKMVKNPEVTIRMRGVMEKCTYCIQRIQNGKIQHKVAMAKAGTPDKVEVPDGTIKTACEQVCPVEAVVFGNIADPKSRVSVAKAREQDYALLGYLNIRPRTTYLGKLRNPNPKMPDYQPLPLSRVEYNSKNATGHGDSHGHEGHGAGEKHAPAHEAEPKKKESGHGSIQALNRFGGLS